MAINLNSLSPDQLEALISNARSQLEHSRSRQVEEVRGKIEALLHSSGLTLAEVFPRFGGKSRAKAAVAPKYRHPEDPSQTWSGRGKRPLWLVALLKKRGVTLDSLLIEADASSPKTARKGARKTAAKTAPARASKKAGKRVAKKAAKKAVKTARRARKK